MSQVEKNDAAVAVPASPAASTTAPADNAAAAPKAAPVHTAQAPHPVTPTRFALIFIALMLCIFLFAVSHLALAHGFLHAHIYLSARSTHRWYADRRAFIQFLFCQLNVLFLTATAIPKITNQFHSLTEISWLANGEQLLQKSEN